MSSMTHASVPAGMRPDEWGDLVHSMMENRHFGLAREADTRISDILELNLIENRRSEKAKALAIALGNFESSKTCGKVVEAIRAGRQPVPELPFAYPVTVNSYPSIGVQGRIDLVFELIPGEWWVVDYKTEARPPSGSYLERRHRIQINAYAWALEKIYGRKVVKGVIAYVYPTYSEDEFTPDAVGFEASIQRAVTGLALEKDSIKGLVARPDFKPGQICSWCPYSGKRGGPCEHYN